LRKQRLLKLNPGGCQLAIALVNIVQSSLPSPQLERLRGIDSAPGTKIRQSTSQGVGGESKLRDVAQCDRALDLSQHRWTFGNAKPHQFNG
jgi:hypothetical protein